MPASKARYRFLRRLWTFARRHADAHRAARRCGRRRGARGCREDAAPRGASAAAADQLRLRAAAVQHRRLRRDEDAQRARGGRAPTRSAADAAALREGLSMLLRVLYPAARTSRRRCGTSSATRRSTAICSTRRGRRSTRRRCSSDEIELVLQVNGKLRGKIVRAGRRRQARDRGRRAAPAPRSRSSATARAPKKVDRRAGQARQRRGLSAVTATAARCVAGAAALLAAGCGFELRRAPELRFSTIALDRLRAALAAGRGTAPPARASPTTRIVERRRRPQVVLEALDRRAREERRRVDRVRPGARVAAARAVALPPAHAGGQAS